MNRRCPSCSDESVSVSKLILTDVRCSSCGQLVGIQWMYKAIFFVVILVATIVVGLVVLIDQGPYAALLMISLPIGAIGIIKARYCPLVIRKQEPDAKSSSG